MSIPKGGTYRVAKLMLVRVGTKNHTTIADIRSGLDNPKEAIDFFAILDYESESGVTSLGRVMLGPHKNSTRIIVLGEIEGKKLRAELYMASGRLMMDLQ